MSRVRAALAACLLLLVPALAPAQAPEPSTRLGVRALAAEVLRANAALRAAGEDAAASRAALRQAGAWPNPAVEAAWADDFAFASDGERSGSLGFSQPLPIAGRLARARDVARAGVGIAESDAADLARLLVGEAQSAALALLALDRAIAARGEVVEVTRALAQTSARRFRAAEISEADVNLLEIEAASLEQEREVLRLERAAQAIALNRLLQRAPDAPLEIDGALEAPAFESPAEAPLVEAALRDRPDLARERREAERARAEARLARAEKWEDWDVGAAYERDSSVIDDAGLVLRDRDDLLAVSLRVPLPLWNRNQAKVDGALARERAAEARVAALETNVRAEVATAFQRAARLRAVVASYQGDVLPRAQRNVELLRRGYAQGVTPVSELVQGQRQLADSSARLAETLGDLRAAEVALETAAAASPLLRAHGVEEKTR